ncbi:MAG: lipid A deacylase LpxR family protein [Gammaproteobacteria bacterium]|nr:lipid A deacylase LpxR family protein [Gammaproteobacteria bacterium]
MTGLKMTIRLNKVNLILLGVLSCFHAMVYSQESNPDQDLGIGVYVDQDFFIPFTNEDRDYTMGVALEFFWAKEEGLYPLDGMVRKAGKWLGIEDSNNDVVYSFMLGALAFTPDDLSDTQPIYDDRPYSSIIYLSNKRVRTDGKNAIAAEVSVGVLGLDLAKEFQTEFHELYRDLADSDTPVEPMGWSHQISDGGELTMRIRLSNSRLNFSEPGSWDLSSTIGLSLGFQTNASAGAAFRIGKIRSPFWSLPFDPVNRGNFIPSQARNEWYFWSAVRAHLVGYDVLLQGQFRDSEVTFDADEIERLVYDAAIGITWGFRESQLVFSANTKTSDLIIDSRRQTWGGINYMIHF